MMGRLFLLFSIAIIFTLSVTVVTAPDVFAIKPTKLTMLYETDPPGGGGVIDVIEGSHEYNTNPSDPPNPPTDDTITVSDGDSFMVLPETGDTEFRSNTDFYVNGVQFGFFNKGTDPRLHTSCSAPLTIGLTGTAVEGGFTHKLILQSWDYTGSDPDCILEDIIGGTGFSIDKSALLVFGLQTTAAWIIPVIVSAIGIGIVLARRF